MFINFCGSFDPQNFLCKMFYSRVKFAQLVYEIILTVKFSRSTVHGEGIMRETDKGKPQLLYRQRYTSSKEKRSC